MPALAKAQGPHAIASPPPAGGCPHAASWEELAEALETDPTAGLTEEEAARRLEHHGPNELPADGGTSAGRVLLAQLTHPLLLVLLVAIALSVLLGHTIEAIAIGAIALFSVCLGFAQELRAERSLAALRRLASPGAVVVRAGRERDVPSREVVPGDLLVLSTGDLVPADGRLAEAAGLRLDEAVLTGESAPVAKHVEALSPGPVALGDRRNMVFGSTAVTSGRGRALVVATGSATEVGRIGALLRTVETSRTPLETDLRRVGRALAWSACGVVLLVAGLGLLQGRPLGEMVVFGIALAVAVVPEALPAVVTISLALGARRMVERNALIRRLPIVEALGSVTVICSDKTGTLTTGEMTVRELYAAGETVEVTGSGYEPRGAFLERGGAVRPGVVLLELLESAALSTDAHLLEDVGAGRWTVRGDPTEGALLAAAAKAGRWKTALESALPRVAEVPFTSERKRMTTLHRATGGDVAISKGAPEAILGSCTSFLALGGEAPLDDHTRVGILSAARAMGGRAMRVLAVARRTGVDLVDAEREMTFLGLVGMMDPPRPGARAAIDTCVAAGIRPIMITGDHPFTARAIAAELGLLRKGTVVTGAELDGMSDAALERCADEIDVYARVSPAHKVRIVAALQRRGEVAAMTGDGVNDAPALKKADVGIAMGRKGTDVAKGAAGMVLVDDDFASIVAAVEEGRAIFDNVRKYLVYLLSSNVGEVLLMAAAVAGGLPLPLTAVQILYVNLATDGLPALALAMDPHDHDLMRRRPRRVGAGIFTPRVVTLVLLGGVWSAAVDLSVFAWAVQSGRPAAVAGTMAFVTLVLIEFLKAYCFRTRRAIVEEPFANRWLDAAIAWELMLLASVLHVPFLARAFGTTLLSALEWTIVLVAALTIVPVLEAAKWMQRRGPLGVRD